MLRKILKVLFKLLFRVEVIGKYEDNHKKTLIIANHSSFIDAVLLELFLPIRPVFVVHTEISESKFYQFFLKRSEYLAIDPSHPMAMKKVVALLNEGRTVVIFPEGRITITGSLMKIYSGSAFAATKSAATIIPVHIMGAKYSYFSRLRGLFNRRMFPKVIINIFPSTKIELNENIPVRERRDDAKDKMHRIMMESEVKSRKKKTIYESLLSGETNHGKKHLVFEDGLTENLSFRDLIKKSIALGHLLKKEVGTDKRVALMLPNSNIVAVTFYALQYLGKVPAMLNYSAGKKAINAAMTATKTKVIITSRKFIKKGKLEEVLESLSDYKIVYLEDLKEKVTTQDKVSILFKQIIPSFNAKQVSYDDEAVILFTSGSEGVPKAVVHSHVSLLTNVSQILTIFDISPSDKIMLCLPTFHVFGLTLGVLLPITSGNSTFMYPNPLHYRAIPEIIYDRGCTILLGTSTFLAGYARFADQYDFHKVRAIIAGAEKLSPQVSKVYNEKFGIRIMEGYGATETAPLISVNSLISSKVGSVGQLAPTMDAQLEAVKGIDEGGKLVVSGDNVMLGYMTVDKPGVLQESPINSDGFREYDTGDIVSIDEKGFLQIKGRVKRFAKLAGEMVSLESAESIAKKISPDNEHAIITREDPVKGEALVLFTTDANLKTKQLVEMAKKAGISALSVAKDIRVLDKIPLFASGKTNYMELKKYLQKVVK